MGTSWRLALPLGSSAEAGAGARGTPAEAEITFALDGGGGGGFTVQLAHGELLGLFDTLVRVQAQVDELSAS